MEAHSAKGYTGGSANSKKVREEERERTVKEDWSVRKKGNSCRRIKDHKEWLEKIHKRKERLGDIKKGGGCKEGAKKKEVRRKREDDKNIICIQSRNICGGEDNIGKRGGNKQRD